MHTGLTLARRPAANFHYAILLITVLATTLGWAARHPMVPPAAPAATSAARLPLAFVPNVGQLASQVAFEARLAGGALAFTRDAVLLAASDGPALRVEFVGASPQTSLAGTGRQASTFGFYQAGRVARSGVPSYAGLEYTQLYPGIDLRYDGNASYLKGTYTLAAGADPASIRWRYAGAERAWIDPVSGDLHIQHGADELVERAPIAWQERDGMRTPVAVRYRAESDAANPTIGFALGAYDAGQPLVIDPELVFGSYLGGSGADYGRGIAVDRQGSVYVVGDTYSSNFLGYDTPSAGSKDVIVLKFNPSMTELVYGLIIGGSGADEGLAIAVNPAGEAYVLADPGADDFEIVNARLASPPETGDGVLIKLSAAGDLLFSTYLGFEVSNIYSRNALAIDKNGSVYAVGETYVAYERAREVALAKLSPNGKTLQLDYSLRRERPGSHGAAVAIDASGRIYIAGVTDSPWPEHFPTTSNAIQKQCGRQRALGPNRDCDGDAFLIILGAGGALEYASYLGGNGGDDARSIALDPQGNIYLTGNTFAADFPVSRALQPTCPVDPSTESCYYHTYVSKLAPGGGSFVYSTYLGSSERDGQEFAAAIAADAQGNAYVTGFTNSQTFPVKGAPQSVPGGGFCFGLSERYCFDAYLTMLGPNGGLAYSTYLGGNDDEYAGGLALDQQGNAYVIGYSDSFNFPASGTTIQPHKAGNTDFYVAKIGAGRANPSPELGRRVYVPLAGK